MRRSGRAALVAAAGLVLASGADAQFRRKHLTVADHLSGGQQEETISVFLGGVLVGSLHVDSSHPDDQFGADVPAMEKLPFALCGKLMKREPDGSVSSHTIDNGGTLTDFADGTWAAITLGDVVFTLEDETGKGTSTFSATPACSAAVS